ncbi:Ig-like domain-containing protein [Cohnella yongneupensis]|uniref:Ig-like domain-containing protein n=1 Tax=Cohnella yongneupensis TaxID=425006 RepID=A0ABW0R0J7_9BACL
MIDIGYWIKDTHPHPDAAGVPEDTLISISFNQEINRYTLNARNILILDGNQGGKLISERFLFNYDSDRRTLFIYLKEDAERLGPRNRVEVILTGRIANHRNERMDVPYHIRFTTI